MKYYRIAILASGSGSTAEALITDLYKRQYPCKVALIICNNPKAFIFSRIRKLNTTLGLGIKAVTISSHQPGSNDPIVAGRQTPSEQEAILALLEQYSIDLVLLLGYMKMIGERIINAYGWLPAYSSVYQARMLNTHPGLLPATIGTHGLGTQSFVLTQGLREAGQTLHVVGDAYYTGPTVAEHRIIVASDDTAETLFARVQAIEKNHIANDVMAFLEASRKYKEVS